MNPTFHIPFTAFIRIVILVLLSVSNAETMRADDPPRILFSRFDKSNGLSSDSVRAVTQDRRGNYWMATDQGLTRYDRFVTEVFTHDNGLPRSLTSNSLSDIVYDPEGDKLWIGTSDAGLNRFDPLTMRNEPVDIIFADSSEQKGRPMNPEITALTLADDQHLWIGTQKGLVVMDLKSQKTHEVKGIPKNAHVTAVFAHKKSVIWVGTAAGELYRWETAKEVPEFQLFWETGAPISSVAYDSKKGIWVGTKGQGLFRLDPSTRTATRADLQENDISSLKTDSDNLLWVGTGSGLGRFNRESGRFDFFRHNFSDQNSLVNNHVTSIFEDKGKFLWITTDGGGASRFGLDRYVFPHFPKNSELGGERTLPHRSIWGMSSGARNTLWLATSEGLSLFDPKTEEYATPDLSSLFNGRNPYIYSVLETRSGDVWASTKGEGLIFLPKGQTEGAKRYVHDQGVPNSIGHDFVQTIFEDSLGTLWFGTNGKGLWTFDSVSDGFLKRSAISEDANRIETGTQITGITEDADFNLWVAATDGLHFYDRPANKLAHCREVMPTYYRIRDENLTAIHYSSDGMLYIGTNGGGFYQFSPATGKTQHYINAQSRLPHDHILGIIEQNDRFIWITTGDGIARYDSVEDKIRVFDELDGIEKRLHQGSLTKTKDGILYFGGVSGFNQINPLEKLPDNPSLRSVPALTHLELFGKKVIPEFGGILEKPLLNTEVVEIPFDVRNQIGFEFTCLDPNFPDRGTFRYQLVNYDEGWQYDKARTRLASYPALRPGKYEFQVQSSPNGRLWGGAIVTKRVVIVPPWYQTWLARLLFLFGSLGASLGFVRLMVRSRIYQIERREEQLTAQRDRSEADLSRQLQNAVLLDRTTRDFRHDLRGDAIFQTPLQNLGKHFKVSRCMLRSMQEDPETGDVQLVTVGEHCAEGVASIGDTSFSVSDVIASAVIHSDKPVACEFLDTNPEFVSANEELHKIGVKSFIAIRTSFLDQPNGMLVLHQTDRTRAWTEDESKLLKSVASQFGNAIAQRDLTLKEERYRTELETARHNADLANAAKSEFLAKMTHELRTPLNAIIGFSQVIREDDALEERQREIVDIINNSGEHLLDVVNDILDVSKIEAGKTEINLEQFELKPLLHSVKEMLNMKAESKGICFELTQRTSLPKVIETDRSKVRQVLINLLGNGLKFTDQGAIGLTVGAEALTQGARDGGQWRRKVRLVFEIRDTGRGIAQHELPRLFDKFTQSETGRRASEGTGLGLPIAKNFVNMLGGDIEVTSKEGFGTIFKFSIDCEEVAEIATAEDTAIDESGDHKNQQINGIAPENGDIRILIAEDQPVNRLLLKKVLKKGGFQLAEAVNGREAYEKWSEWKPHLILMDEDMPIMKGSEATVAILKECHPDTAPVIISLTAYAFEQAREKALSVGCKDFISKPFKANELYATIAKHLDLKYTYAEKTPEVKPNPEIESGKVS